jgi:hypothetical protein
MFCDFHLTIVDVKDLAADAEHNLAAMNRSATLGASFRVMNDELIRLRDLPESVNVPLQK